MFILIYILGYIIWGCVWGFAVNAVISNKNYSENWFWWGFFFGWIALIVACTKPQNTNTYSAYPGIGLTAEKRRERDLLNGDGWKCKRCGTVNPSYTGSCGCGMNRHENNTFGIELTKKEVSKGPEQESEQDNIEEIKKYKELLDCNIITQEEFNQKKNELLKL